jgi:hypothetical protein
MLFNPSRWDRIVDKVRSWTIAYLQRRSDRRRLRYAF